MKSPISFASHQLEAYDRLYGKTFVDYGIEVPFGASGEVKTRCPQCSHTRRKKRDKCLSVNVDEGVWHCWHCGWKGGLREGVRRIIPPKAPDPPKPDNVAQSKLRRRWKESCPIAPGDPVDRYLSNRKITLNSYPRILRYHPKLCYAHDDGTFTYHPAMLARIDNVEGRAVSLHRTYLTPDGRKADVPQPKKCMTPYLPGAIRGGAIRLFSSGEVLAVAEGIETALSVHVMSGLPVWAAICDSGLAGLKVPATVKEVAIFADHDPAGIAATEKLAERLVEEGKKVRTALPSVARTDWNDDLRSRQ